MSTPADNTPAWYHATQAVPASAPFGGGDLPEDERRGADRKSLVAAAALLIVIVCSIGVSVSALRGGPSDGTEAAAEAAEQAAQQNEAQGDAKAGASGSAKSTGGTTATTKAPTVTINSDPKPKSKPAGKPTTTTAKPSTPTTKPTPTTTPPTTAPPTTTPPTTTPPTTPPTTAPEPQPAVTSVTAPADFACSAGPYYTGSNTLTLEWTTTNAVSVSVAIDSPTGIYQSNLPANGSLELSGPCGGDTNTYYVIAVAADGTTATDSVVTTGHS